MEHRVKISILIPVHNAEKNLRKCLDSIKEQTFRDFEVLCLNDGSTDSSAGIISEYTTEDARFIQINKPHKGYGHILNTGLDLANGEYAGIIGTDDYAEPDMFEKLYRYASADDLDAVKAGFYRDGNEDPEKNCQVPVCTTMMSKRVLCPTKDFKAPRELVHFFSYEPSVRSGLYRLSFLRKHKIYFTEIPGAAIPDTAFNFKVWFCAEKVRLLTDCVLHYLQSNAESDIISADRICRFCDEYDEIEHFMINYPRKMAVMTPVYARLRFDTYDCNSKQLPDDAAERFMERFHSDFIRLNQDCAIQKAYFSAYLWQEVCRIIEDSPTISHQRRLSEKNGTFFENTKSKQNSGVFKIFRKKLSGGYWCYREHGMRYTFRRIFEKLVKMLED